MRHVTIALLLSVIFFLAATRVLADAPEVVISEVQIAGTNTRDEFVELYNKRDAPIALYNWEIRQKTKNETGKGTLFHKFSSADIIPAKSFFLWTNKDGQDKFISLADAQSKNKTSPTLTENNSLALLDQSAVVQDTAAWGSGHSNPFTVATSNNPDEDESLIRNLETLSWNISLRPSPTNSRNETILAEIETEEQEDDDQIEEMVTAQSGTVRINELFPNPKEKGEVNEFIELYNFGAEDIDLTGFVLRDASATGKYILPAGSLLPKQAYFLVAREKSKLSLNNTDETVSLFDPAGESLDTVTYATSKEGASLGYAGSSYRWSKYRTPGAVNEFSEVPQIEKTDIPKKAYPNMPTLFSAKGDADEALVYAWDFGDGVKSRKQNTTHTYKKKGTYAGSLTITGSLENSVKNFTVQVRKMPKQKISIRAIAPNPSGPDTQGEWLMVKNEGKKKVDLAGWSIATGATKKKMANHPVRESFVLKGGEERKLTTELAAFSLPNKTGVIELRQPDKKSLQKISYAKTGGIKEDEVYQKQKDKNWIWTKIAPDETSAIKINSMPDESEIGEDDEVVETDVEEVISPEEKKVLTLADLAPEDVATLKAQVKEELRQEIVAELAAQKATENLEKGDVSGVSMEQVEVVAETVAKKKRFSQWFSTTWQQSNGVMDSFWLPAR